MGRKKLRKRRIERLIRGGLVRLTPRKKKVQPAANGTGGTSVRMESVRVPSNVDETAQPGEWFRLGPIMTTVLVLGLIWIAIVSWFVSRMPER